MTHITIEKAQAQQLLDALESLSNRFTAITGVTFTKSESASMWLRQAIAAPEKQPKREWVGLTDEEMFLHCPNWLIQEHCKTWIQQIEAKLKEKNAQPALTAPVQEPVVFKDKNGDVAISVDASSPVVMDYANQPAAQPKREPLTDKQTSFNAAINFAIEQGTDAAEFLRAWREGDTSEWPEFVAARGIKVEA